MGTLTNLLSLYKPDIDETGWGALRNTSYDDLDTALGTQHGLNGVHRIVTVNDGSGYIKFPELTTIQRDSLPAAIGFTIYNTDDNELQSFQAGTWQTVIGSSLTVTETDLGPNIGNVTEMRFPNTTVTDLGSGTIQVTGFLTDGEGVAVGDTVYFDGNNWSRVAPGTAGQRFETNGAGSAPTWESAARMPLGTDHGDILYWDGAAWVVLTPGTSGQLLRTLGIGAPPSWITPAGGGNVSTALDIDDNAIVRGDGGTVGVQTSGILIDDSDNVTGIANLTTTGTVTFNGVTYTFPAIDGGMGNFLQTNGSGTLVWAAGSVVPTFSDSVFRIQDDGDATKQIAFEAVAIATATTRTITMPDADVDLGDLADIPANTTHRTSDGSDHTFIDQSVVSGSSPTLDGANITGVDAVNVDIADAGGIITATEVEGALQENRTAIDLNTAKVTNATHTGDVTGDTALTAQPAIITGKGAVAAATDDLILISDTSDTTNLKQVTAQSIADLAGGGASLTLDINQTTHGFSVNEWVYHNGTIYALTNADDATTAESIGIVSAVAGVDDFTLQFGGRITGLSGLTAGENHFLSDSVPGTISATAPTTENNFIKPVLIADSVTTGFVFNMRGNEITSTTSFFQAFVDGDLDGSDRIIFTHNLGHVYAIVQIYDENDLQIIPDEIELLTANTLRVDLTSFSPIAGTWHVVILDIGTTLTSTVTRNELTFTSGSGEYAAGIVTMTHNLGEQFPQVQIYDDSDQLVQPDDVTATSTTVSTIDLTSFDPIPGTWHAVAQI